MAGAKVTELYKRKLYNNSIDTCLKDSEKTAKVYRGFALSEEKVLLDKSKRRQVIVNGMGIGLLRNISEEWEKAGDYEQSMRLKECYYDRAMNAAEILSATGETANERRILLKIKRSGCMVDIATYKNNRHNAYLNGDAEHKPHDKIV